jgi:hypothetical protein
MNWLLAGILAGSLITSTHETEEQCLGRKAMLEKLQVQSLTCTKLNQPYVRFTCCGTTLDMVR